MGEMPVAQEAMSKPAIVVENLSKAYRLGMRAQGKRTFREALMGMASAPLRRLRKLRGEADGGDDTFWALKDVSFEVQPGEVVGIIGRNGAGKSTLLKVLSRITEPTSGTARLRGRVASLLEVGTGFHPELTGRENIYLNGAILGMKRAEIARKFDEIVAFAEVEKFLDTPVKHYSSGMYVRLAFAVAAHLEPEIIIVDEVLAVGDAEFQKKCLGKMQEVSKGQGRTVLFVSHNMRAIRTLCTSAILIKHGMVELVGPTGCVVSQYCDLSSQCDVGSNTGVIPPSKKRITSDRATIVSAFVQRLDGTNTETFHVWDPVRIVLDLSTPHPNVCLSPWVVIYNDSGDPVLSAFQYDESRRLQTDGETCRVRVTIDPNPLMPGTYYVSAGVFGQYNEFYDWSEGVLAFRIEAAFPSGRAFDNRLGAVSLPYTWECDPRIHT